MVMSVDTLANRSAEAHERPFLAQSVVVCAHQLCNRKLTIGTDQGRLEAEDNIGVGDAMRQKPSGDPFLG